MKEKKEKKTICIINPNTSTLMTEQIRLAAEKLISNNFMIKTTCSEFGPESIEGYYDEAFCVPGIINEIKKNQECDAYIIACFDDTGIDASRSFTDKPVLGIGECSYHAANLLGGNFTVITTLSRSIPKLKSNLNRYGLLQNCNDLIALEIPVLDLEKNKLNTEKKIDEKIKKLVNSKQTDIIVLGCAGMVDFANKLQKNYKIPVIEGISASIQFSQALLNLNLKTSKLNSYAYPRKKNYLGEFSKFKP